jgi:hypothetical protein
MIDGHAVDLGYPAANLLGHFRRGIGRVGRKKLVLRGDSIVPSRASPPF